MGKGKKKGWKKLPRDADENIEDVNFRREISNLPDEEMFFVDTTALPPEEDKPSELTFKQKASMNHKLFKSTLKDQDVDMKELNVKISNTRYDSTADQVKPKTSKASTMYDLWCDDDKNAGKHMESTSEDFESVGIQHYNKTLKRTRREKPKATRFMPNIVPAVEVSKEGASYNPALDSYVAYANEIAKEELKMEKDEKRIDRKAPAKNVANVNPGADFEDFRTLLDRKANPEVSDEEGDVVTTEIPAITDASVGKKPKQKTIKQKKRELRQKIQSLQKEKDKLTKKQRQEFNNLKKTMKELRKEEAEHKEKIMARKQQKVLDAMTKRKKLGRGEFKPFEEPVLLTDELTGSLRTCPVRGNILEERFKSLQKRNILPIAGDRRKSNRKTSLKVKFVEKRSAKEVKKGSRVL